MINKILDLSITSKILFKTKTFFCLIFFTGQKQKLSGANAIY